MNISNIFSSFLAIDVLSIIDNDELKRYSNELRMKETGVIKSNYGGWQSDMLTVPNAQITLLVEEILKRAEILKYSLGLKEEYTMFLTNLWININQKSNFNRPHLHTDSILSGVYYVDCVPDSGQIVFLHPSIAQKMLINENAIGSFTEFSSSSTTVDAENSKLIIFPSWLEHYVEPNRSDQERISIAFNINIKKVSE